MKAVKKIIVPIFVLSIELAVAQSNIVSTGVEISGTGGSFSGSVGQIDYLNNFSTGGSSTEGVQQALIENDNTGLSENVSYIEVKIGPNPTTDYALLELNNEPLENMYVELYDIQGNEIWRDKVTEKQTKIKLDDKSNGIYLVVLASDTKKLVAFKIQKKS